MSQGYIKEATYQFSDLYLSGKLSNSWGRGGQTKRDWLTDWLTDWQTDRLTECSFIYIDKSIKKNSIKRKKFLSFEYHISCFYIIWFWYLNEPYPTRPITIKTGMSNYLELTGGRGRVSELNFVTADFLCYTGIYGFKDLQRIRRRDFFKIHIFFSSFLLYMFWIPTFFG